MQQEWRQEVVTAIDQALAETSRLAERQLAVQEELRSGRRRRAAGVRAEQGAIEEGVQRLLEQMRKAAGKNALVPPEIGAALGGAQQQMQRTREAIVERHTRTRAKARSRPAARWTRSTRPPTSCSAPGATCRAPASGSGLAEALERMAQLAQQQGGLGQQGAGLLPMAGNGAIREQLRQLGATASAPSPRSCRSCEGRGNIPGAGEMADEAKDLARRLEGGRLDRQMVERQERLFRRMLDAGRTLQGREEDERKERQSTTATDDSVHLPPALRARLLGDDDRLRVPDLGGAAAALARGAAAGGGLLPPAVRGEPGDDARRAGCLGLSLLLSRPAASRRRTRQCRARVRARAARQLRRGGGRLSQRPRRAGRPIPRRCSGSSACSLPLDRAPRSCPRCGPRSPASPSSGGRLRRGAPGLGGRGSSRTACGRSPSGGRRLRRTTRRRTASGARPRSAARDRAGARRGVPAGPRAAAPARRAGGRAGAARGRRRRLRRRAAGVAAGASAACPGIATDRGQHAGPGARTRCRPALLRELERENDFAGPAARGRPARSLGRSARAARGAAGRAARGSGPGGRSAARAARPAPDSAGPARRDGARAARSSSSPSGARTRSARGSGSTRRGPTPPPGSGTPRAGCWPASPTIGARPGQSRPGAVDAPWSRSSSARDKLDEAARRLAEHRPRHARATSTRALRRRLVAGLRSRRAIWRGPIPRSAPTARSTASRCAGGSGSTAATSPARSSGFKAAGPFAGDRAEATERTALLALLQPIEADSAARLWARRAPLARGDTRTAVAGLEQVARRACRRPRAAPRCACSPAGWRPRRGKTADAERLFKAAAAPEAPGTAPAAELALAELLLDQHRAARGGRPAGASHPHLSRERAGAPGPAAAGRGARRGAARHDDRRDFLARGGAGLAGAVARARCGPAAGRRRPGCWSRWTTPRPITSRPTGSPSACSSAAAGRSGSSTTAAARSCCPPTRPRRATPRSTASPPSRSTTGRWCRSGASSRAATWTRCRWRRRPRWRSTRRPTRAPWDDAVTMALNYAGIKFEKVWDAEVLGAKLKTYDWLHLHHEDFTGPVLQVLPQLRGRALAGGHGRAQPGHGPAARLPVGAGREARGRRGDRASSWSGADSCSPCAPRPRRSTWRSPADERGHRGRLRRRHADGPGRVAPRCDGTRRSPSRTRSSS